MYLRGTVPIMENRTRAPGDFPVSSLHHFHNPNRQIVRIPELRLLKGVHCQKFVQSYLNIDTTAWAWLQPVFRVFQ
jgi:hypothetical protein